MDIQGYSTCDQFLMNILLQGWDINDMNQTHMQYFRNMYQIETSDYLEADDDIKDMGDENDWKANYKNPIKDNNISQYAVSINRMIINARAESYDKNHDEQIIIAHFAGIMWKYYINEVFSMMKHSMQRCKLSQSY